MVQPTTSGAPLAKVCSVGGCGRKSFARGWCVNHYMRWYRTGTTPSDSERDPTVCVRGHALTAENVGKNKACLTCKRIRNHRHRGVGDPEGGRRLRSGYGPAALCRNGLHALTPDNLRLQKVKGRKELVRFCLACQKAAWRRAKTKAKQGRTTGV